MPLQQAIQWPNAINASLDGTTTTAQVIIPFKGRHAVSFVETYNGDAVHTLVATLTLEISNNYDRRNPSQALWDNVSDPGILAWLTTDQTATPPGGKPNGTAGHGSLTIDPLRAGALRWTVTRTAGQGLYVLDVEME